MMPPASPPPSWLSEAVECTSQQPSLLTADGQISKKPYLSACWANVFPEVQTSRPLPWQAWMPTKMGGLATTLLGVYRYMPMPVGLFPKLLTCTAVAALAVDESEPRSSKQTTLDAKR